MSAQTAQADHAPTALPRSRAAALGISAGLVAVALFVFAFDGVTADWVYVAVASGAAVAAWIGATRARAGWIGHLIAIGLTLSALADLAWQVHVWTQGHAPDVSIADVFWIGGYIALAVSLLRILRADDQRRMDVDGVIDVAVVVVVAMLVQWELAIHELVTDTSVPVFVRFVWALYPALDAVILALVLRAVMARRLRGSSAVLLGAGAGCWLIADFAYTLATSAGVYSIWLDALWLVGAVFLAGAARRPGADLLQQARHARSAGAEHVGHGRLAVALLPLLVPAAIEVIADVAGQEPDSASLLLGSAVLVGLAFLRAGRILQAEAVARAAVRSQERYAKAIALRSSDAVAVLDRNGIVLDDSRFSALVGYADSDFRGLDAMSGTPADLQEVRSIFRRSLLHPGETFETEVSVRHRDARDLWLSIRLTNLLEDDDVGGVVLNMHDVTDRKRVEDQLAHQAFHDGLTGLANRALFHDRIEQALRRNVRTGHELVVLFLDLDGFKTVNDSLGHGPGDELLHAVAARLEGAVRTGDTVARLGGDEFAILIEQSPRSLDEAQAVAERAMQSLSVPVPLADQLVTVSVSIGIAVGGADATAASLLRDADVAMYQAKAAGKARSVVYDPGMRTAAVERLQLETDLAGALEAGQLALVYQPVVELESDRIIGFEALLRWHHPELGSIPPDRFIPIAEENGLILPIGRWVLAEACRTTAQWHRDYPHLRSLTIAVNVSGRQISSCELPADVSDALTVSGLDPRSLVLEMTETALVHDPTAAARRLQDLKEIGVRLAIDDFGTGYSSLSYLRQFPVDIIKIDRSFVNAITDKDQIPAIVRGLLDLGRTLDVATVAEGVERDDQRARLRDESCGFAQGFLFAEPLEPDDVEILLLSLPPGSGPRGEADPAVTAH